MSSSLAVLIFGFVLASHLCAAQELVAVTVVSKFLIDVSIFLVALLWFCAFFNHDILIF